MTGPEHYARAEQHLREAFACTDEQNYISDWNQRQAQVHATLALAAATALGPPEGLPCGDSDDWNYVASAGLVGVIDPGPEVAS